MKKLKVAISLMPVIILLLALALLTGCKATTTTTTTTTVTESTDDTDTDATDATNDTEPTPPAFAPLYAIQIDNNVYLSDTIERRLFGTGPIDKVSPSLWIIGDQLFQIDATADAITMNHTPTQARDTPDGLYTCIEITPAESQAAGAQPKWHTEFFLDSAGTGLDSVSQGHWVLNQMRCTDIITAGSYTFAINEAGAMTQIGGTATTPLHVFDGEFLTHNRDLINTRIDFNDQTEDYAMNYLPSASQWIKHGTKYYSETGDIWSGAGLQELVTVMKDFNEAPRPVTLPAAQDATLVSVGVRPGAGTRGDLIYWIEANTGWLIEYDPVDDEINTPYRMYVADGMQTTGTAHKVDMKPVIISHYIYFSTGGILKRLDLETGFFDVVYSGVARIWLID